MYILYVKKMSEIEGKNFSFSIIKISIVFLCVALHDNIHKNPEWFSAFQLSDLKKEIKKKLQVAFQFEGDFCENSILIVVTGQAINYARSNVGNKRRYVKADLCAEE